MNTNILKKFAQETRRKLMQQVAAKLEQVLHTDSSALREKAKQVQKLRQAIEQSSKEQIIDHVAYTWFNRLMALRFMDVNDYQPLRMGIITPTPGFTLPELLEQAKQGTIPSELTEGSNPLVKEALINDLLDGKVPSNNPQNEIYTLLLVGACNHLSQLFPFLFEKIEDYSELLLPDDLISELSIVHDVRTGMSQEDCQEVEIIGWLYQFYISEKKDEVYAAKTAFKKEDIPAATQLFTPRWIVEYMVQNTLGKLWLQNRPDSPLRKQMPYYIESPSAASTDFLRINSVEEITFLDQACGSGHILVYAFELFCKIYEEEGYSTNDIPPLILEKNLFGFEIDERAAQLAALALMMKARSYHSRFFRKETKPTILCYQDLPLHIYGINGFQETFSIQTDNPQLLSLLANRYYLAQPIARYWTEDYKDEDTGEVVSIERSEILIKKGSKLSPLDQETLDAHDIETIVFYVDELKDFFRESMIPLSEELYRDLTFMVQASNLGSLIAPRTPLTELNATIKLLDTKLQTAFFFEENKTRQIKQAIEQLVLLSQRYHCIVDNPPYMGNGNMNTALGDFVKRQYPDSKADLMACFMEAGLQMLQPKGFLGMINQHSWMFLSSYEKLREKLVTNTFFDTLLHLGPRTFPEIGGEVVQNAAFTCWNTTHDAKGTYIRLVDLNSTEQKRDKTLEAIQNPNCSWFYNAKQKDFEKIPGSVIGYWLDQSFLKLFSHKSIHSISESDGQTKSGNNDKYLKIFWEVKFADFGKEKKWVKHPKGGVFRRWFGNLETVIDWSKQARTHYRKDRVARILPERLWWKNGISWTLITSGKQSFRDYDSESIFNLAAPTLFFEDENQRKIVLGLLNTKITEYLLKIFNPTLNCNIGEVQNIPYLTNGSDNIDIIPLVDLLINISKQEWNTRETSWDFEKNELIRLQGQELEESYELYKAYWSNKFYELHRNEEELNRQFIDIYGLQDELTPDVPLEDITLLKDESTIQNGQLVFKASEIMAQFVSYAVGCMFGRYSLDKQGLILANQGESLEDYLGKVGKAVNELRFVPDEDNIIPILDDEWFEDDIVGCFTTFLKASFGTQNFDSNLAFVEECLGKDIRKYFTKDFYSDHIKRYKKRPIYWMFSSPKGSFNVLIYMHRYTPDTLNTILTSYLVEYRAKLTTRIEHFDHIIATGTSAEQSKAIKEQERIKKILNELKEYEREILYPLATERIHIDLDEGVLVNYNKLGGAIKEITGLNDKATKKKVAGFDWIDTKSIK